METLRLYFPLFSRDANLPLELFLTGTAENRDTTQWKIDVYFRVAMPYAYQFHFLKQLICIG